MASSIYRTPYINTIIGDENGIGDRLNGFAWSSNDLSTFNLYFRTRF